MHVPDFKVQRKHLTARTHTHTHTQNCRWENLHKLKGSGKLVFGLNLDYPQLRIYDYDPVPQEV